MLLIHMLEWLGPSSSALRLRAPEHRCKAKTSHVSFYSELPQDETLAIILKYQAAYNQRYGETTAVNFTLLGISQVDSMSVESCVRLQVNLVSRLQQDPADF